jgi:taurine dioxygenase
MAAFSIKPFSAALGAEITGLDLSGPLAPPVAEALGLALAEHLLVVVRDQRLGEQAYVAFARAMGEVAIEPFVETLPGHPEIIEVLKDADENDVQIFGESWHTDFSFLAAPPSVTMLHALDVPARGGDTCFVNLQRAYDALSDGMKAMLAGLGAVHEGGRFYGSNGVFFGEDDRGVRHLHVLQRREADGEVSHPVVRRHPVTGRGGLFVNQAYTLRLDGMTAEESRPILGFLYEWCRRPEFTYRHAWRPGDVTLWDNRATQHKAINDYDGERRRMWRITLAGETPAHHAQP